MGKGRIFRVSFVDSFGFIEIDLFGFIEIMVFLCNGPLSGGEHQVDTGMIAYSVLGIYGGVVLLTVTRSKITVQGIVLHISGRIHIVKNTIQIH